MEKINKNNLEIQKETVNQADSSFLSAFGKLSKYIKGYFFFLKVREIFCPLAKVDVLGLSHSWAARPALPRLLS